jgi:hypothetical protein
MPDECAWFPGVRAATSYSGSGFDAHYRRDRREAGLAVNSVYPALPAVKRPATCDA